MNDDDDDGGKLTECVLQYAYESLIRIEFGFGRTYDCVDDAEQKTIYSGNGKWCPVDLAAFLRGAGMTDSLPIWAGVLVQCLWIVTFRLLAYFSLKLLHTTHKPRLSSWKAD